MKSLIILISILSFSVFGQKEAKEQEAFELSQKAIELMDFGKVDQSITLLEKCITLDPTNFNYPYELGYAYKLQRDYQNAILTYKKAVKYKDATDQCYQMLGNVYEASGDLEGALKSYKKGLKKFPKSGKLYYEIGNIQVDKSEALKYYEKGINADPSYPTNYYVLAKYFLTQTKVEMWGMIYGELFMNIERGSARTEEIGKLIYDKYKSEIKVLAPNSISVSFYNGVIDVNNTSKIPLAILNIEMSNVPPPKSYTAIVFSSVGFKPNPYARLAAVGSLIILSTSNPANLPASRVACLCASLK